MDGDMIRDVLAEGLKVPERLKPNTFMEHFDYHCKLNHGGGSKCSIKKAYLVNQKPPRMEEPALAEEAPVDVNEDFRAHNAIRIRSRGDVSSSSRSERNEYLVRVFQIDALHLDVRLRRVDGVRARGELRVRQNTPRVVPGTS